MLYLAIYFVILLVGGWTTALAVERFKQKRYFWFGWYIFIACELVALLFYLTMTIGGGISG